MTLSRKTLSRWTGLRRRFSPRDEPPPGTAILLIVVIIAILLIVVILAIRLIVVIIAIRLIVVLLAILSIVVIIAHCPVGSVAAGVNEAQKCPQGEVPLVLSLWGPLGGHATN